MCSFPSAFRLSPERLIIILSMHYAINIQSSISPATIPRVYTSVIACIMRNSWVPVKRWNAELLILVPFLLLSDYREMKQNDYFNCTNRLLPCTLYHLSLLVSTFNSYVPFTNFLTQACASQQWLSSMTDAVYDDDDDD